MYFLESCISVLLLHFFLALASFPLMIKKSISSGGCNETFQNTSQRNFYNNLEAWQNASRQGNTYCMKMILSINVQIPDRQEVGF